MAKKKAAAAEAEAGAGASVPPPLFLQGTSQYERDLVRLHRRGWNMERFRTVLELLRTRQLLGPELRDHSLKGQWKEFRECHVAPDWLLVYRRTSEHLILARTGTQADLFEK